MQQIRWSYRTTCDEVSRVWWCREEGGLALWHAESHWLRARSRGCRSRFQGRSVHPRKINPTAGASEALAPCHPHPTEPQRLGAGLIACCDGGNLEMLGFCGEASTTRQGAVRERSTRGDWPRQPLNACSDGCVMCCATLSLHQSSLGKIWRCDSSRCWGGQVVVVGMWCVYPG